MAIILGRGLARPRERGHLIPGLGEEDISSLNPLATKLKDTGLTESHIHGEGLSCLDLFLMLSFYPPSLSLCFRLYSQTPSQNLIT